MDINEENDTITVASSPWVDGNFDTRKTERIGHYCKGCNFLFFDLDNQWRGVGRSYVFHARGEVATATIELGMKRSSMELDGTKELKGCKLSYLTCRRCNTKVGIHCLRGTRARKFRNIALLRQKKIVLKKKDGAPAQDFVVINRVERGDSDSNSNRETREVSGPRHSSSSIPIRDSVPLQPPATEEMAPNPATEPACKACRLKHMKCDKRKPTCTTCEMTGRYCVWDRPTQLPSSLPPHRLPPTEPAPTSDTPVTPVSPPMAASRAGVDCGQCRMRHIECDRAQPMCSFCVKHVKKCNYNAKKANAVDKASFQAEETLEFYGGDIDIDEQIRNPSGGNGGGAGGGFGSNSEDDGIQPIRPRTSHSADAENIRSTLAIVELKAVSEEHTRIIERHESTFGDLLDEVQRQRQINHRLQQQNDLQQQQIDQQQEQMDRQQQENSLLMRRVQTMENILKASRRSDIGKGIAAFGDDDETKGFPDTTPLVRQNAPARRGGGMRSGTVTRSPKVVTPAKRLHEPNTPLEAWEPHDASQPTGTSVTLAPSLNRNDHVIDNSLYDATPPPKSPKKDQDDGDDGAMEVEHTSRPDQDDNKSRRTSGSGPGTGHGRGFASTDGHTDEDDDNEDDDDGDDLQAEEAETQRYLREHVRDEDSDDDDFRPTFDDSQSQFRDPGTASVAASVERLLSPSRPLQRPVEPRGGIRASGRGRGSSGRKNTTPARRAMQNASRDSFVPSTPSPNSPNAYRTTPRRGFSGFKPVPSELSHDAFSSSQAATPTANDPAPKRQKTVATPVSYVTAPRSNEKLSSVRYPNGRVRDNEGYLLNNNGERDKRSIRGRMLGMSAFRKSEGSPRTVQSLTEEQARGSTSTGAGNAHLPPPPLPTTTAAAAGTPLAQSSTAAFAAAAASAADPRPTTPATFSAINAAPTAVMGAPAARVNEGRANRNVAPDVGALAAQAEQDRLAKAHDKGQKKEYSAKHKEIMAKMRL